MDGLAHHAEVHNTLGQADAKRVEICADTACDDVGTCPHYNATDSSQGPVSWQWLVIWSCLTTTLPCHHPFLVVVS